MNQYKTYISFILLLFLLVTSCTYLNPKNKNDITTNNIVFENSETQKLYQHIKAIEYFNLPELKTTAEKFLTIKSDTMAQVLGKYYLLKYAYYKNSNLDVYTNLEKFYERLKGSEYDFLRVEIDYILLLFYTENIDYEAIAKRQEKVAVYISKPQFELERSALLYGFSGAFTKAEYKDRLDQLNTLCDKIKSIPWSIYHSRIHSGLGGVYYQIGNTKKSLEVISSVIKNNQEAKLIQEQIHAMTLWSYLSNNSAAIDTLKKAVTLANATGYTCKNDLTYRTLGNISSNLGHNKEAYEAFKETIKWDTLIGRTTDVFLDKIYASWIYYNMDKGRRHKIFNDDMDQIYKQAPKRDLVVRKMAIERKLWTLSPVKNKIEYNLLEKQLKLLGDSLNNDETRQTNFYTSIRLKLRAQNYQINNLELTTSLNDERLARQRLVLIASSLALILLAGLLYIYLNRYNTAKRLNKKNAIIAQQNSEMKGLIKTLEESNQNLENFAQVAAHDMKSPLNTIKTSANILKKKMANKIGADEEEIIEYISKSCNTFSDLINDLLLFASITQNLPKKESVDIQSVIWRVREILKDSSEQKNVQFILQNHFPKVVAHNSLILQLFLNLISNSIKYSKPNEACKIQIGTEPFDHEFELFFVKDNGIGIGDAENQKVFDLFHRLHSSDDYEGSGVGLATCKKIIEHLNGKIWIESEKKIGTTVFFTLPLISK